MRHYKNPLPISLRSILLILKLAITEPKDSTLFIWKSSVWHNLEQVFTSYLFLSPPHSRSFTITIICSFFYSPYLSFLVLLLQFTLQLSLACFAEYVLHLTRLNPDMMYIHQDSGLVNVSYFKFDVDDTTGGCVQLLVRLLYIDIFHCSYLHLSCHCIIYCQISQFSVSLPWYIFQISLYR